VARVYFLAFSLSGPELPLTAGLTSPPIEANPSRDRSQSVSLTAPKPMSVAVGSRVQPREAIGTVEKIRTTREGYLIGEVLWDTGARCPEPLSCLILLEDREAEREAARLEARELRRLERERLRQEQPERECDGCPERFKPTRNGQRFHSKSCRNRANRLGL
jgi:hypothetical protein